MVPIQTELHVCFQFTGLVIMFFLKMVFPKLHDSLLNKNSKLLASLCPLHVLRALRCWNIVQLDLHFCNIIPCTCGLDLIKICNTVSSGEILSLGIYSKLEICILEWNTNITVLAIYNLNLKADENICN